MTQNGNLDGLRGYLVAFCCCMHRHMYTATYRTVCYGWRVGIVHSIVIVTATAAPDCDLKLLQTSNLLYYITLDESILGCESAPKTHDTSVFPGKNGGTVEDPLRRRSLFVLQYRICGLPWCSPNKSGQYYFRHIAPNTAPVCGQTALGVVSLPL